MIVISGITSAVGIHLAAFLANKGIRVRGFARRIDKVKSVLGHPLIELKTADLADRAEMQRLCKDAESIVHIAALSAPWGLYEDFYRVNVEGTQSLACAASEAQLERFIHISTPSIYFDFTDRLHISEEDPLPNKPVNAYAKTKRIAEEVVHDAGIPHVILRPRAIFGPHDQTLFPRLIHACRKGAIPCFRKRSPLVDITYVENLVEAIWLSLKAPATCLGQTYNVTNGEPSPLIEVLQKLLKKLSMNVSTRYIPYPLAYTLASLSEYKSLLTKKEPVFTRYGIGVLAYSQTLSIEKAQKELKYQPIINLNEGIDRYVRWLHTQ